MILDRLRVHLLVGTLLLATAPDSFAQWSPTPTGAKARLRGVSVVDDKVVWASGAEGTVEMSNDGGLTWRSCGPKGTEKLDFRDVQAFSDKRAVAASAGVGELSKVYFTEDGGETWELSKTNSHENRFFDAIAFSDPSVGFLMGDPIDGRFLIDRTKNGGKTWTPLEKRALPLCLPGESAFAASGTCLAVLGGDVWIGTGGSA